MHISGLVKSGTQKTAAALLSVVGAINTPAAGGVCPQAAALKAQSNPLIHTAADLVAVTVLRVLDIVGAASAEVTVINGVKCWTQFGWAPTQRVPT
jgi:hypothetical protein